MGWMVWSSVTALFFIGIAAILLCMTIWELKSPTVETKGFLPFIATTRGDRVFIGLLGSGYIHLMFLAVSEQTVWIAFGISVAWFISVLRWG
jgi:predicted small integral membrane protein